MKRYIPVVDYKTFYDNVTKYHIDCLKLDILYNPSDHRNWTALLNIGKENIFVTFSTNKYQHGDRYFDVIASDKVICNLYIDDIYDTISLLVGDNSLNILEDE